VTGRELAQLYFDRFPHDPSLVDALSPEFVFHHLRTIAGRDAFRAFMADVSHAFPDFGFDVHHLIAEGPIVAANYTFSGTQHETFMGSVPSRGGSFSVRGASFFECGDGRIERIWVSFHSLAMMQQLGAVQLDV
jgi:steroid delta-isomerase-like uncharacterized protein